MKNSTKGSIGEPLTRYSVQQLVRYFPVCLPLTSDDNNFFVRTLFWVFLDPMESPFSQNSTLVLVEGIR